MRRKIQGLVSISAVVEVDGSIGPARVVRSLDQQFGLDEQALAAVKQWRFKPGMKDGAPVRVLITATVGFNIRDLPPASTWPIAFTATPADPIDVSNWRDEVGQSGKSVVRVRYPPTWKLRREGVAGLWLSVASPDGLESVAVMRPRAALNLPPFPMGVPDLQLFAETMKPLAGASGAAGVGQAQVDARWWLWQEVHVPTSFFDKLVVAFQAPELAAYVGARQWYFTTRVDTELVIVVLARLMRSGLTAEMADAELRSAGGLFNQIVRQITFETR